MKIRSDLKESVEKYLSNFWDVYNSVELIPKGIPRTKKTYEHFLGGLFSDEWKKNFSVGKTNYFWDDGELQKFMENRRDCFHWDKERFDNTQVLPKVNRLKNLGEDVQKDVIEVLKHYSVVDLGCHNLSDRLSLLNPKKYGSVRGIVSVPKFGLKEKLLEITNGEYKQIREVQAHDWDSSSMIDENGNMWFSHSWSVIKDKDSPYYGVHFDVNTISWKFLGEFYSVQYKWENQIFDFENMSRKHQIRVSEWLDYEMISLYVSTGSKPFWNFYQDTSLGSGNYLDLLLDSCDEISSKHGYKFLYPLFKKDLRNNIDVVSESTIVFDEINSSEEQHQLLYTQWKKRLKKTRGEWRNTKNQLQKFIDIESEDWKKLKTEDEEGVSIREKVCIDFYKRLLPREISEQLDNG